MALNKRDHNTVADGQPIGPGAVPLLSCMLPEEPHISSVGTVQLVQHREPGATQL